MSRCGITGTTHKSQAGDGSALIGRSVGQLNESLVVWLIRWLNGRLDQRQKLDTKILSETGGKCR